MPGTVDVSALRSIAEWLSRNRVVQRRLPSEFGGHRLYVSPDAALRFWRPGLAHADPVLLNLGRECIAPGDAVWDIGANVGLFTFAAAYLSGARGRVLAVEADDWLTLLLRRSQQTIPEGHAPIDILTAAIADQPGVANFAIARRGRAGSHLGAVRGSSQSGGSRWMCKVLRTTLDALLETERAPNVIKIDVESAEVLCLRGADRVLREARPKLICEVGDGNAEEVGDILNRHRYAIFDGSRPPGQRQPLRLPVWTTLALPQSA